MLAAHVVWLQTPEFGSADAQVDVDQQIDDIQNAIRKAEVCDTHTVIEHIGHCSVICGFDVCWYCRFRN